MLNGAWTYRSYFNNPALVSEDAQAALAMIFGEGQFLLTQSNTGAVTGKLDMGGGYALELSGNSAKNGSQFELIGLGIADTPTAGWRYDYRGVAGYSWPNGINQVPSLLGTVIRVNAHGPHSPAGVTASFVAVKQPEAS